MKIFRRTGVVLLVLIALVGVGRLIQVGLGSVYNGEREPYLQSMSDTAVTIRWQTLEPNQGVVRYGMYPDRLEFQVQEAASGKAHEVRLTDLKPATHYYYSVGSADKPWRSGVDYWFVTSPPSGAAAPVRFWVVGDVGYPGENADAVTRSALRWLQTHPRKGRAPIDFWLTTGDNAYRSGSNKQYQAAIFEPHAKRLRNVPIWPAYGNHDARRWAHFKIFTLPENGEAGGVPSGTEHYFSFDYANVHVVMLDSESSNLDANGPMLRWLKDDLEATSQAWVVAVLHHPPYSRGTHNSDKHSDSGGRLVAVRENILPVLEAGGVDLVLSGHSHMYERSKFLTCHYGPSDSLQESMILDAGSGAPEEGGYKKHTTGLAPHSGTVYLVLGSSSKLDQAPLDHPVMVAPRQEMGSVLVDINKQRLNAVFVNRDGAVADQFSIVKGVASVPPASEHCPEN